MRLNISARLKGIEEALYQLFVPVEIMISPLSGRDLGFATNLREEFGRQEFRHRSPHLFEPVLDVFIIRVAGGAALSDIEKGTIKEGI